MIKVICKHCGKENPEGSKFCLHCGRNMGEEPTTETAVPEQEVPVDTEETVQDVKEDSSLQESSGMEYDQSLFQESSQSVPETQFVPPKKKSSKKKKTG